MTELSIDLETYSSEDLASAGVYRYAETDDFEILLFAYAFDDEPVQVVDLACGGKLPPQVRKALTDPQITKIAYNANFERTCLSAWLANDMPPEQWSDTMITAAELSLPRSLADVGRVIGITDQKMSEGKNLIQYFCKPCKPTKVNGGRTRNLPEHAPEKWETFKTYCARDVEAERQIRRALQRFSVDPAEQSLWEIDQRINDRGVGLDLRLAENAAKIDTQVKNELMARAIMLTGLDNPNSVVQVKKWIYSRTGVQIESLNKQVIGEVRDRLKGYPAVLEFLDIRKALGKTSTAKYPAMLRCVCEDGRMRGLTQFYGANRSGRWGGRLVQLQNLPQNKMPDEDLDIARQMVKGGETAAFKMLFEPAQTLSELIRTALVPRPGYKFIVSDFSAIEARVLAWLAGEKWRLDVFNSHGKIYEASAEKMFHLEPGSVRKGDPYRTKGKIAELALGYGGAAGALIAMGALEMGLQEEELKPLVDSWRSANRRITGLWWDVDVAARSCLEQGDVVSVRGAIRFRKDGPLMRVRLPSGRELSYVKPKLSFGDITYEGYTAGGGWGRIDTYGPKLVENIIQAIARDCLAVSMRRLEEKDIPIVFHVHDEVICEVPEKVWSADQVADIMSRPISWAPGLPLRADAYECHYYRKD